MDRVEGIVCRVLDYKDSSKILYIYTEFGQRSIIARGVKKLSSLNRNLSQVGNIISFENSNRELATLKEGELVHDFDLLSEGVLKKKANEYNKLIMRLVNDVT